MFLVKEIKDGRKVNVEPLKSEFRNALRRVGRAVVKDYDELVSTWEHKPVFKLETHVTARLPSPSIEIYPRPGDEATEIYGYVNLGTRPHEIWAGAYTGKSDHRVLSFFVPFVPKTRPGRLSSTHGYTGNTEVHRPYVQHPGSKGRFFDKAMIKKWEKPFYAEMHKAMHQAAIKSGHSI